MSASLPLLQQTLRRHGQSLTAPRRAVYGALSEHLPLTMADLIARCPDIDRASVYRTVALFERLGIAQRLQTGWKYRLELSDQFQDHHHHATCLHCGRSLVVPESASIEEALRSLAAELGFELQHHQLELQGRCASCQRVTT